MAVYYVFNELREGVRQEEPTIVRMDMVETIGPVSTDARVGTLISMSCSPLVPFLQAAGSGLLAVTDEKLSPRLPPGAVGAPDGITIIRPFHHGVDARVYYGNGHQVPLGEQWRPSISVSDFIGRMQKERHYFVPLSVAPRIDYSMTR